MQTRHWLTGLSWLLPTLALAADPAPATSAAADPAKPASSAAAPVPDLKNFDFRQIARATALATANASAPAPADQPSDTRLADLPFRAPRRVHHHECDSVDCVAYAADGTALFSFPREQMIHAPAAEANDDDWLSCQQNDDMLSTFERYDKCRGVGIGLPPKVIRDVEVKLPSLRL